MAMEDFVAAFNIVASSSDFVLASDLSSAYSALSDAWGRMQKLESQLEQGPQHSQQHNSPAIQCAMGYIPQTGQNQIGGGIPSNKNSHSIVGIRCPAHSHSTNSPFAHTSQSKIGDQLAQECKLPNCASKNNTKTRKIKESVVFVQQVIGLESQNKDDPEIIWERLEAVMVRSQVSQKLLEKWDKDNGLPRSLSKTLVDSGRTRKQLQTGVVIRKGNGDPLASAEESEEDKEEQIREEANDFQKEDAASSETMGC
eukprot:CAMPEP_0172579414 /NCGR_PEP_ID=MMETSP1067-20121228/139237_1 /TAXON_ID=265564 ORGANISM="Thalassiosira punctigera, Strain Tpunct2005C2" /NCGR_SAMPLE_ID=MMETSP1067 /ASSEMBLY_ACC=CAM_ASM_000444 /LENGTH=254 /DNA_ID=CAMNT_0013372133 /DNA_START=630 /DNA_END=1395 /DNA_ORIENTATION=-